MPPKSVSSGVVARTRPPAKLNLFLELLARREDGFHEIDTVMVPIDWCDEMQIRRTEQRGIDIQVTWLPSAEVIARRLGIDPHGDEAEHLLKIPSDENNLVHRALKSFSDAFDVPGGFSCTLGKSIPAGAGMGGASSDAASALRSAAALCGIPSDAKELTELAAGIGSDVPFFLGLGGDRTITAARARGRGESLEEIEMRMTLHGVVVFPGVSLSTAAVYANSQVDPFPQTACRMVEALENGDRARMGAEMVNRLSEPAKKLAPQIVEILESLWRAGLGTCQLTGSGSACFAVASSAIEAKRCAAGLRAVLEPGAIVVAVRSTHVPATIMT